ncbi:MAG: hypothetical protein A2054_00225 [Deltaproteobacteria bacterium GWA2_55_10]|nr:MAG: hypothetical protein A2054_00225 [Deltaproteobacteria bacterium GWA2_55_10]
MFFRRKESYDRESCLDSAAKAQAAGRVKKAIGHYKRVLEADPDDYYLVHAKIAPLLARMKKFDEAWESFRTAALRHLAAGFSQKALSLYSQAARFMPGNPDVWDAMAYVYVKTGQEGGRGADPVQGAAFFQERAPQGARD